MSKKVMIVLVLFTLVLGGYFYTQNKQASMKPKDTMMVKDEMVNKDDVLMDVDTTDQDKMMKKSSRYLPFTPTVLADSSSQRRVLYFYASWCSTCIPANADLEKNASSLPSDLTVIRVNYNDPDTDAGEKALATKYGITYQHTFVQIDEAGEVVAKWNGGATKELLAKIK